MKQESILLSDLKDLLQNKSKYLVNKIAGYQGLEDSYGNGTQDEYNEYFIIYKHPGLPEGYFMKETYNTDSYGGNEFIASIDFVKGVEKTIVVFE